MFILCCNKGLSVPFETVVSRFLTTGGLRLDLLYGCLSLLETRLIVLYCNEPSRVRSRHLELAGRKRSHLTLLEWLVVYNQHP
jgi:hypothetical protein